MNNKDIPEDQINERVARAQGWVIENRNGVDFYIRTNKPEAVTTMNDFFDTLPVSSVSMYKPLTNHNQFHEIWTAEMEAKACDVLDEWFFSHDSEYWHSDRYKANRRLWQLRAYCEVMENKGSMLQSDDIDTRTPDFSGEI
jgi:hypothetical protein